MKNIFKIFVVFFVFIIFAQTITAEQNVTSGISKISLIKKYKDINLRFLTINKLKQQTQNLSDIDKKTIIKYVCGAVRGEDTFLLINCYLRNNLSDYLKPKDINKPLKCRLSFYVDNLSRAVAKSKIPQNIILYKGINNKDLRWILKGKNINDITDKPVSESIAEEYNKKLAGYKYTEKSFMLTSYDKNLTENTPYMLEIKTPKNVQGVLLDEITGKHSKSVLINKGYRWEIQKVSIYTDKKNNQHYKITIRLYL